MKVFKKSNKKTILLNKKKNGNSQQCWLNFVKAALKKNIYIHKTN